ncbi:hypothetical protein Lal_00014767 [Lupinus albus]|nr:hypothetical protein Lal_00014767 [Lupinus albus]
MLRKKQEQNCCGNISALYGNDDYTPHEWRQSRKSRRPAGVDIRAFLLIVSVLSFAASQPTVSIPMMMTRLSVPLAIALLSVSLAACKKKNHDAPPAAPAADTAAAPAAAAPAASEKPAPAPAAAQAAFDPNTVPVTNAPLPPFPFLKYPDTVTEAFQETNKADFDEAWVIAGKQLRKVEGRVESHQFSLSDAKLSRVAARRNYENLVKAMGGVKVNDATPNTLAPNYGDEYSDIMKKVRLHQIDQEYDCYLVRRPNQLIWIALMFTDREAKTLVIAEEPFKQTVGFVTAEAMQSALASAGHVALYINFDTDKAAIRSDARPAVDEITKLLEHDPALKLTIEGHTDNSGDAAHNKALSQQRADAVMGAIVAAGIARERLSAVGMGDSKPLADNGDEAGRAKNRRVELVKRA